MDRQINLQITEDETHAWLTFTIAVKTAVNTVFEYKKTQQIVDLQGFSSGKGTNY